MKDLSLDEQLVVIITSMFCLCNALSNVFLNVYLYVYAGSVVTMAVYTIFRIGMFPFFYTYSGHLAAKRSPAFALGTGLVVLSVMMVSVLSFQDLLGKYTGLVYAVGILQGIGESFYYSSAISLQQVVSTPASRAKFISLQGVYNNLAAMLGPVIGVIVIGACASDLAAYRILFAVVAVIYVILTFVTIKVKSQMKAVPFSVLACMKLSRKNEAEYRWKVNSVSTMLFGFNNSLYLTLIGILVYEAVGGTGGAYSKVSALFSFLTVFAYMYLAKFMKNTDRDNCRYYLGGALALTSASVVLTFCSNMFGAMYYGIVQAVANPYLNNAYNLFGMAAIAGFEERENISGRVAARETYLSIGRCLGMAFVAGMNRLLPGMYLQVSVVILSCFYVLAALYNRKLVNFSKKMKI